MVKKSATTRYKIKSKRLRKTWRKRMSSLDKPPARVVETKMKKKIIKKKTKKVETIKKTKKIQKMKENQNSLDLALICDCTGSMCGWMTRAKQTLNSIITNVKNTHPGIQVRVAFVGYRDFRDKNHFSIQQFTTDINLVRNFIHSQNAGGGGDQCEDVTGGLKETLDLDWRSKTKISFLICDAPTHGKQYHNGAGDNYLNGSPNKLSLEELMKEFSDKKIHFTGIKLNNSVTKMFDIMKRNFDYGEMNMRICDFDNFKMEGKTFQEVSKEFVKEASYIILSKLNDKKKKKELVKKWKGEASVGDWFSFTNYFRVRSIMGEKINVGNIKGREWDISLDILQKMNSAEHFEKEVALTRTELVEKLNSANDKIFTVKFHKMIKKEDVVEKLKNLKKKEIKDSKILKKLSKKILTSEPCSIIGKLRKGEATFGRTRIRRIDLKFGDRGRLVDHRTIESLIIGGIKYVLKTPKNKHLALKEGQKLGKPKRLWDPSKLAIGNMFSMTTYCQVQGFEGDVVRVKDHTGKEFIISKEILEYEMDSGNHFDLKEKMCRTKIIEVLENVKDKVFKIGFKKKRKEKEVHAMLMELEQETIDDDKKIKKFAKNIIEGEDKVVVGHLVNQEAKMGRSLILDLDAKGVPLKQVDHRTIKFLIVDNNKYYK